MFNSILNKLILFTILLILSVTFFTWSIIMEKYLFSFIPGVLVCISLWSMYFNYRKYDKNILFLLNALDNGDYSFNFTENKLTKREQEMNRMLNRIKAILINARKEIIENEKFLSLIVESISTGIVLYDDKGNVQTVNQAAVNLLGLRVFTHLKQLRNVNKSFPELFRNLRPEDKTQIKIVNEREELEISLRVSAIKLQRGVVKVVIFNNIENELEAKEIDSWIRLIRVMTHEITNSIAPISSLTDTLLFTYKNASDIGISEEQLKKNTLEALETINTTSGGLLNFVESYRKFTGVPKPQLVEIKVKSFLEKIQHLGLYQLKEKNIDLEIIVPEEMKIKADESQMSLVLINLLKNAIESFEGMSDGNIRIIAEDNPKGVRINICNNGKPILQDILPHIFIPFFTTKEGGSGIGLSLSRYIMRLHGGNLKHHTKDGWTVFSMVF